MSEPVVVAMLERLESELVATRLQVSKTLDHVRSVRKRIGSGEVEALLAAEKRPSRIAYESYIAAAVERGDWAQAVGYLLQTQRRNCLGATKEDYEAAVAGRLSKREIFNRIRSREV